MPYLNQPQQIGPYRSENTFAKGLLTDSAPDATPNTVLTGGANVHLLRQQGSELILADEPGMQRTCLLPPDHLVHGWAERAGVLYLLLAEVESGTGLATGRGQLGTFPSPDYQYKDPADPASELVEQGELTNTYRPLRVYYGDSNGLQPTDFISLGFNLSLDAPSELELQDSYDGTLNIVVNDRAHNPALLVNSGFVVLPRQASSPDDSPGTYRVVLRQGDAQTNRYSRADFSSRLRLFPKGNTLGQARLVDVVDGGKLRGGEYRYYFTYCDADDNETSIFAELGPVFVFDAPVPAAAFGSRPGEATQRQVNLQLSNLDPTLGYVRISYSYRAGEPEAAGLAYQLTEKLRVAANGTLRFAHTGYASEQALSLDQLQHAAGSLSAFTTMCQAANHLLLGGTRLDGVNDADLLAFARQLKLGHEQISLPQVPGLEPTSEAGASLYQPLDHTQFTGAAGSNTPYNDPHAAWVGGYLNALNSCYRLGYMGGESYPFGVRFILDDYSVTETYPLLGIDNLDGSYPEGNYADDSDPAFYNSDGWASGVGMTSAVQNRSGVYRFPADRSNPGSDLRQLVEPGQNAVNILAARVSLPDIPAALRARCVGVQFMRAARRPNCVAQGYALPTLLALQVAPGGGQETYDHFHGDFKAIYQNTTTSNLKLLPTLAGVLEAVGGTDDRTGAFPFAFNKKINYNGLGTVPIHDSARLALYAPDALLRPSVLLPRLNEQPLQVRVVGVAATKAAVPYQNPSSTSYGGSWSLRKTTAHQGGAFHSFGQPITGRGYWTLDNQPTPNKGRFGSQERVLLGKNSNDDKYQLGLAFDPYVGLQLDALTDPNDLLTPATGSGQAGQEKAGSSGQVLTLPSVPTALLVNVYTGAGLLTAEQLRGVYPLESLSYQPISERLSWDELEGQLDGDRRLLLYGGDTFVGLTYRRIFRALPKEQRWDERFSAPVGQVLSLVCETTVNPYARSEEVTGSGVSSGASFSPRLGYQSQNFNAFRDNDYVSQAESTRYNAGYNAVSESSLALVLSPGRPLNVPFRAQQFGARVWASALAVDGSFSNGYRFLPPLSFKDYDRSLGSIVRLLPVGSNQVLIAHEHGLELLGLNDRALTGADTAGPVYAEAASFLPAQGTVLSRELGCQHPFAVCVSPKGVYGVDAARGCTWFWPLGGGPGSVRRLSDFAVSADLRPMLKAYERRPVQLGQLDIRVVYDPLRADVVFSLYQNS